MENQGRDSIGDIILRLFHNGHLFIGEEMDEDDAYGDDKNPMIVRAKWKKVGN